MYINLFEKKLRTLVNFGLLHVLIVVNAKNHLVQALKPNHSECFIKHNVGKFYYLIIHIIQKKILHATKMELSVKHTVEKCFFLV